VLDEGVLLGQLHGIVGRDQCDGGGEKDLLRFRPYFYAKCTKPNFILHGIEKPGYPLLTSHLPFTYCQ
jgi:hypothetical protein